MRSANAGGSSSRARIPWSPPAGADPGVLDLGEHGVEGQAGDELAARALGHQPVVHQDLAQMHPRRTRELGGVRGEVGRDLGRRGLGHRLRGQQRLDGFRGRHGSSIESALARQHGEHLLAHELIEEPRQHLARQAAAGLAEIALQVGVERGGLAARGRRPWRPGPGRAAASAAGSRRRRRARRAPVPSSANAADSHAASSASTARAASITD